MQEVAAVQAFQHSRRLAGILHRRVEIDDAVELAAGPDPGIDRLARRLAGGVEVHRALERRQRAGQDLHAARVGPRDQLAIAGDQIVGGDGLAGVARLGGATDIVDTLQQDHAG
nr:hypothetical protein [Caulobacter sp. CCH9-E1]